MRHRKPRLKQIDVTPEIVARAFETAPTPVTAKALARLVCGALGRAFRDADHASVCKALRVLEAQGIVRCVGAQPPANGLGRASRLWERVA